MQLQDRAVIVTGAASGIGRALAHALHKEGAAHVVAADINEEGAHAVAAELGARASGAFLDAAGELAVKNLVAQTESNYAPVELFVSNAGYVTVGGLEAPAADLQRMWEVHVLAHLFAARACIPRMAKRGGGYLLNTASAAGLLSQLGSLHYSVTKHAAVALAEWIAITHRHQGIRVSVLCPQAVETNIAQNSPQASHLGEAGRPGGGVAAGDGVLQPEQVARECLQALAEERFHVLPHKEVAEYVRRKAADVDRWLGGMQRWQGALFPPDKQPALWLTGQDSAQ